MLTEETKGGPGRGVGTAPGPGGENGWQEENKQRRGRVRHELFAAALGGAHPTLLVTAEGSQRLWAGITCFRSKCNRTPGWELLEGTVDDTFLIVY